MRILVPVATADRCHCEESVDCQSDGYCVFKDALLDKQ